MLLDIFSLSFSISKSSIVTLPDVFYVNPVNIFRVVVFPAPF